MLLHLKPCVPAVKQPNVYVSPICPLLYVHSPSFSVLLISDKAVWPSHLLEPSLSLPTNATSIMTSRWSRRVIQHTYFEKLSSFPSEWDRGTDSRAAILCTNETDRQTDAQPFCVTTATELLPPPHLSLHCSQLLVQHNWCTLLQGLQCGEKTEPCHYFDVNFNACANYNIDKCNI